MKRLKFWIIAALAAALALSIAGIASAQPTPPSIFTGTVTNEDGSPAAAGLSVEAYVDGTDCTYRPTTTGTNDDGATIYYVEVENTFTNENCGGSEVTFRIGGQATTPANNARRGFVRLNLTLGPETVTINVAVWRLQADPTRLFVSTQAPGESWVTHPGQLVMTEYIGRNRWDISDERPVEVTLTDGSTITINVAVWRLQADPTRLFISTQAPGESWVTHPGQLVMTEYIGRNRWDISDERPVVVELE